MAAVETLASVADLRERLRAAAETEARETLAALDAATGGLPERVSFTHDHIHALVLSAFFAGAAYECERRKGAA